MLSDLCLAGLGGLDRSLLNAELRANHRVASRRSILRWIPPRSTGAELGVFTGLFSALLARQSAIHQVTFVDPWHLAFGDHYPDWGSYTHYGRLTTRTAYEAARRRIERGTVQRRVIEIAFSYDWLGAQADRSLDWVYLDSTHTYDGTVKELTLLDLKLTENGVILGDDWQPDRQHRHHGVFLAVNEFLQRSDFEVVSCGVAMQWVLRRRLPNAQALSTVLWQDPFYAARSR